MNSRYYNRLIRSRQPDLKPRLLRDESEILDSRPQRERREQGSNKTQIFALLVGINDYPEPKSRHNGCIKDVEKIATYLHESYGEPKTKSSLSALPGHLGQSPLQIIEDGRLHLCVLKDEQATYARIVQGFRDHLCRATSDDTVWFHFSGHGTEVQTAAEFEVAIEPNGKDQALLCYQNPGSSDPK